MLDAVDLFKQKSTRDEMGTGSVRDAFADMFFLYRLDHEVRYLLAFYVLVIHINLDISLAIQLLLP